MTSPEDFDVNDPRFNQTFQLPADPANGRAKPFTVRYADFGYRNEAHPEEENVILFFAPLMGSRFLQITKDAVAKQSKVRFINPDRPGMGGTDPAPPGERVALWRVIIPALLTHLKINHVSLASHSGGTIYALDLLLHSPEILHPTRPYVALGAPWIMPSHTASTALGLVRLLPAALIGQTDKAVRMINSYVAPAVGASVGVSMGIVAKVLPPKQQNDRQQQEEEGDRLPEGTEFEEAVWPRVIEKIYAEGVQGVSDEAVLLMKKGDGADGWGDWGDYDVLVPRLVEAFRRRRLLHAGAGAAGAGAGAGAAETRNTTKLVVDVFYAEKDLLIGDGGSKGPLWFDALWEKERERERERDGDGDGDGGDGGPHVEYRSRTVMGPNHDRIWDLRWGVAQEVISKVGGGGGDGDRRGNLE